MHPLRIAAQLHPQHGSLADLVAAARRADDLGYDLVYTWDHFFPLYGEPDGPHFECWTLLSALASVTDRAEIGPLVCCVPYRNPDLLADMARTVDHLSGGRLVLGVGAGWFRRDFDEYGYDFRPVGERMDLLEAGIDRIDLRWQRLNPAPIRSIPLLIGGVGERRTLRMVAARADGWHALFPDHPAQLEPKVAALRRWCDELGRAAGSIEWGVGVEPDDLDRFLRSDAPTYLEMGFTQFTLGFNGSDWDVAAGREWLAWRDEVNRSALHGKTRVDDAPIG